MMERYDVRPRDPRVLSAQFSGGNQQKLVLAREAMPDPKVLLVGQPTRGVDIGAIEFIHGRLRAMRDAGGAVLVVSSELDEIFALADRVLVMTCGRITGEMPIDNAAATRAADGADAPAARNPPGAIRWARLCFLRPVAVASFGKRRSQFRGSCGGRVSSYLTTSFFGRWLLLSLSLFSPAFDPMRALGFTAGRRQGRAPAQKAIGHLAPGHERGYGDLGSTRLAVSGPMRRLEMGSSDNVATGRSGVAEPKMWRPLSCHAGSTVSAAPFNLACSSPPRVLRSARIRPSAGC
jgi:energy-coupling factor transporter ATP-binding protein EcfA2